MTPSVEELIDSLRYRPVATTAAQMREAADALARQQRVIERYRAAIENAAATFADFDKGLRLLNRPLLGDACTVAEAAMRAALAAEVET